jgi:hypothetical protein
MKETKIEKRTNKKKNYICAVFSFHASMIFFHLQRCVALETQQTVGDDDSQTKNCKTQIRR